MFTRKSQRYNNANGAMNFVEKIYPGTIQIYSLQKALTAKCPALTKTLTSFPYPSMKNRKKEMLKWVDAKLKKVEEHDEPLRIRPLLQFLKLALESDGKLFTSFVSLNGVFDSSALPVDPHLLKQSPKMCWAFQKTPLSILLR